MWRHFHALTLWSEARRWENYDSLIRSDGKVEILACCFRSLTVFTLLIMQSLKREVSIAFLAYQTIQTET